MTLPKRHRRRHSPEFKAMLVAQCQQPGASIAAVAMAHQINDNMLRTWLRQAREAGELAPRDLPRLIPLQLAAPVAEMAQSIRIHIQHGSTQIHVEWPVADASRCGEWLQGWLR